MSYLGTGQRHGLLPLRDFKDTFRLLGTYFQVANACPNQVCTRHPLLSGRREPYRLSFHPKKDGCSVTEEKREAEKFI